jgi:hypothetical protein
MAKTPFLMPLLHDCSAMHAALPNFGAMTGHVKGILTRQAAGVGEILGTPRPGVPKNLFTPLEGKNRLA